MLTADPRNRQVADLQNGHVPNISIPDISNCHCAVRLWLPLVALFPQCRWQYCQSGNCGLGGGTGLVAVASTCSGQRWLLARHSASYVARHACVAASSRLLCRRAECAFCHHEMHSFCVISSEPAARLPGCSKPSVSVPAPGLLCRLPLRVLPFQVAKEPQSLAHTRPVVQRTPVRTCRYPTVETCDLSQVLPVGVVDKPQGAADPTWQARFHMYYSERAIDVPDGLSKWCVL